MRNLIAPLVALVFTLGASATLAQEACYTGPITGADICVVGNTVSVTVPEPVPAPEPVMADVHVTVSVDVNVGKADAVNEPADAVNEPADAVDEPADAVDEPAALEDGCFMVAEQKYCPVAADDSKGRRENSKGPAIAGPFPFV